MAFDFAGTADRIVELQGKISTIMSKAAAQTKDMQEELKELEETLLLAMQDANIESIAGANAEAKLGKSLRVSFDDYEAWEKFCYRKKALHLMQRRISTVAYRELKESLGGKPVPGLKEYEQPTLSVKVRK